MKFILGCILECMMAFRKWEFFSQMGVLLPQKEGRKENYWFTASTNETEARQGQGI